MNWRRTNWQTFSPDDDGGGGSSDGGTGTPEALTDEMKAKLEEHEGLQARATEMKFSSVGQYIDWLETDATSDLKEPDAKPAPKPTPTPAPAGTPAPKPVAPAPEPEAAPRPDPGVIQARLDSQWANFRFDQKEKGVKLTPRDEMHETMKGESAPLIHALAKKHGGNVYAAAQELMEFEAAQAAKAKDAKAGSEEAAKAAATTADLPQGGKPPAGEDTTDNDRAADAIAPDAKYVYHGDN